MPRWLLELQSCKEEFPPHGRLLYSSLTALIQYLLPMVTVSYAHYQIFGQLKIRMEQKLIQLAESNSVLTSTYSYSIKFV